MFNWVKRLKQYPRTIISKLQHSSQGVVDAMERSSSQAGKTVPQIDSAADALIKVLESIDKISDMNMSIASASEEQASVAEEINRNVTNIRDIAQATSKGSLKTMKICTELNAIAGMLGQRSAKFKV